MRRKRLKIKGEMAYYHLMSRTVNGEAFFGTSEKEVLRRMIWKVAEFSGIRVVTYAVMKNHFHLLVEVPAYQEVDDAELVRRYRLLYPEPTPWQPMRAEVLSEHLSADLVEGRRLREQLVRRMGDVSWLMKTLKQRFSLWFNRSRERFGPVWSERFKSVLVEGDRFALRTVAAYIDLNPVRAGLVEDPKDYRFCGYGEALGGGAVAREGLRVVDRDLAGYRQTLFGVGAGEKEGKVVIDRREVARVLEGEKGKLPLFVLLRCRVRYFTEGKLIGSQAFVSKHLARERDDPERGRSTGKAHPMKGTDWHGLAVGRGLKSNLFR